MAALPHIASVYGLGSDFIRTTRFDPAKVLHKLKWPVDLLHQRDPEDAILQFCREMSNGTHNGDPVASLLLMGPGGAGKSTLLHRLTTREFLPSLESTDGLCIGSWLLVFVDACALCCSFTLQLVATSGLLSIAERISAHRRPSEEASAAVIRHEPLTSGSDSRRVILRTVDFGGQHEYLYTHTLFCTSRAVYAVCVPLAMCCHRPVLDVVAALRDYMSMVQARAPNAPVALVFTKSDEVVHATPNDVPDTLLHSMCEVASRLQEEFPQLCVANTGTEMPQPLFVSSKDGWEESQEHLCQRLAALALESPGAGDTLPHSYGALRQSLAVAGRVWKQSLRDDEVPPAGAYGVEEHKGVEGPAVASPGVPSPGQLNMRWGVNVPVVTVEAVRDMAIQYCGFSHAADIHQPLVLLHNMGALVCGGAICPPSLLDPSARLDTSKLVVLDAQWLADILSRVVTQYAKRFDDTGRPCHRGQVSLHDVGLAFHGYPDELRGCFLEIMFALEVALPVAKEDGTAAEHFIVPALLSPTPSHSDDTVATLLQERAVGVKQVNVAVEGASLVSMSTYSASVTRVCLRSVDSRSYLSPILDNPGRILPAVGVTPWYHDQAVVRLAYTCCVCHSTTPWKGCGRRRSGPGGRRSSSTLFLLRTT